MAPAHSADEAAIREQAYLFWEEDGRPEGREMEYWSRAAVALAGKAQLDTLSKAPPKDVAAPKTKAAASKVKASPAKAAKPAEKSKPKKK